MGNILTGDSGHNHDDHQSEGAYEGTGSSLYNESEVSINFSELPRSNGSTICSDAEFADHLKYIKENLKSVVMAPASGSGILDLASLDELEEKFPNVKEIGVMIAWFIDSANVGPTTIIKPGIDGSETDSWQIADYKKNNAYKIRTIDKYGIMAVNYGGSISDEQLLAFVNKAKEKGKSIVFYPVLMVDDEEQTWRGHITGQARHVKNFYENQYLPFITHYAELLQGKVDTFYLGSELEGLTSVKGWGNDFPFVDKLCEASKKITDILGYQAKISYAANWTEYHSCLGEHRPLDKLWAFPCIDHVGISYYMPLTSPADQITFEKIQNGFTSGEGIDYYIDDNGICKIFASKDKAWKNIKYWWESEHQGYNNETKKTYKTPWIAGSKKIKFCEIGARPLDRATDALYLHGNNFPKSSNKEFDPKIQTMTISAALKYNVENSNFIEGISVYCFDSRPKQSQQRLSYDNLDFFINNLV